MLPGLVAVAVIGATVLTAPPAWAAYGAVVSLPASTMYSPYGGPATVTFTFASDDPPSTFRVRVRRPGQPTIEYHDVLVDPGAQTSPHVVPFSWAPLTVAAPTGYVIEVLYQGGPLITSEPFTLLPKLVSNLSATPSPFYPLIQDGYKDDTSIDFSLAADTTATTSRVYEDDVYGRCCGTEIRSDDLGPLAAGDQSWTWDGKKDDGTFPPKGTFFVKIEGTDAAALWMASKALKVDLITGWIRETATKEKVGSAYSRTADKRETAVGGDCSVSRNVTTHEVRVLCVNAAISVYWNWGLKPGERIEKVSFVLQGGFYGCRHTKGHTTTQSFLRVLTPPISVCHVTSARITYSYPVKA